MNDYAGDITAEQAWELLKDTPGAVLVDVRTEAEWRFVGVPDTPDGAQPPVFIEWVTYPDGARNPRFMDQLIEAGVKPGAEAPVIFLCRSGQRSIGAAIAATAAGIGPSYNVLEGFEGAPDPLGHRGAIGWQAAGLPWHQG
jgi:rhodanese-related sulfurtransferase